MQKSSGNQHKKMPAMYISHGGGPCFFMEWTIGPADTWTRMEKWLGSVKETLPEKPRAIVIISGHWEEPQFTVYKHKNPPLFYDYYGFPEHTYKIRYPAKGSPDIASEIEFLFLKNGLVIDSEYERGFDHGVFIPLKVMFPDADIPVVQLSLKTGLNPEEHMAVGRALAPLRKESILLIGSGNSFHNLNLMMSATPHSAADEFDNWLDRTLTGLPENRKLLLSNWSTAPGARICHPREDHLIPLMVISGSAESSPGKVVFKDRILGALNSSYQFD